MAGRLRLRLRLGCGGGWLRLELGLPELGTALLTGVSAYCQEHSAAHLEEHLESPPPFPPPRPACRGSSSPHWSGPEAKGSVIGPARPSPSWWGFHHGGIIGTDEDGVAFSPKW
ncbi:uncharacterized protein ACOB8E_006450 isoform 2-T2 [Sarcophilus harrisii]